ncbi:MAG: hypothetical protein IPH69_12865 [Bacteroidales bacterium]|nr:hypothetical protein [Bacteroidales bacterium]MBK7626031.1 hypothetical protein [Bacteroidales bacterium]
MIKTIYLTVLFSIMAFLTTCNGSNNSNRLESQQTKNQLANDSIQLTALVRQVYKWHMTTRLNDFPYKYEKPSENIFTGIDWESYDHNIEIFKKTNFFTDQFLSYHKTLALNIDSSINKADIKWRDMNEGIPIWDTNADDWCGCQDYPDNYWEILTLTEIKIANDTASFYWTWNKSPDFAPHKYKMTALRKADQWRINSLEGFNYYGSVEYYDGIMKE